MPNHSGRALNRSPIFGLPIKGVALFHSNVLFEPNMRLLLLLAQERPPKSRLRRRWRRGGAPTSDEATGGATDDASSPRQYSVTKKLRQVGRNATLSQSRHAALTVCFLDKTCILSRRHSRDGSPSPDSAAALASNITTTKTPGRTFTNPTNGYQVTSIGRELIHVASGAIFA